jgi:hypothetical protein
MAYKPATESAPASGYSAVVADSMVAQSASCNRGPALVKAHEQSFCRGLLKTNLAS